MCFANFRMNYKKEMAMRSNRSAFDRFIKEHATERLYYFDRVDILVNDLAALGPTKRLLKNAKESVKAKVTYKFESMPDHIKKHASRLAVGFKIELSQPSVELLAELAPLLLKSHYTISWLEIAYDINTGSTKKARELFKLLSGLIVVEKIKKKPTFRDKEYTDKKSNITSIMSAYFGQYQDSRMFKMYIPKGNRKAFGSTSVHTEFRFDGAEEIRKIGVWTIQDLADKNLPGWYKDNIGAYSVNKTEIGATIRKIEGKCEAKPNQRQKDFNRKFGPHRAVAHAVYHNIVEVQNSKKKYRNKQKLQKGLIDCGPKWLSGPTQ